MSVDVILQHPADNVAPAYATIGVNSGTEDADYPAAYLADGRLGRPAKLTSTSGSWVLAFSAPVRVDLVALGPHNLTSATLEGNPTNAWTLPAFSAALTISSPSEDGHAHQAWRDLTTVAGYDADGFAYWRLVVSGSAPCAVGEIWLGAVRRVTAHPYQWGFTDGEAHPVIAHETEFGVPLVYALGSRARRLAVSFLASQADALLLRAWYRALHGAGHTGLFIPDASINDAWWVRQAEAYAEDVQFNDARAVAMTLVEHASGLPL